MGGCIQAEGRHLTGLRAALLQGGPETAHERREPVSGILLGPADIGMVGGIFGVSVPHKIAVCINQCDLAAAGTDVNSKEKLFLAHMYVHPFSPGL